jgi:hypothetical protein
MGSDDGWKANGLNIEDGETLLRLKEIIENESAVIVEHRFYRGASAPRRFVCDDFDELEAYVRGQKARPGDSFWIWKFETTCRDDNATLAGAKKADHRGTTPTGGAY